MINNPLFLHRQLDSNHLTGLVPTYLETMLSLQYLFLANNGLCPVADYSLWHSCGLPPCHDYSASSCEACLTYTCLNGGNCTGGTDELFNCTCDPSYYGDNCEIYSS